MLEPTFDRNAVATTVTYHIIKRDSSCKINNNVAAVCIFRVNISNSTAFVIVRMLSLALRIALAYTAAALLRHYIKRLIAAPFDQTNPDYIDYCIGFRLRN